MITNLANDLRQIIKDEIAKALYTLPVSQPCKVESRNGVYVSVVSLLNFGKSNQLIENVPIMQSQFITIPVTKDDIGLLVPCSYDFSDIIEGKGDTVPNKTVNTGGYYFIPLVSEKKYNSDDKNIVLQNAESSVIMTDKNIELNGNSDNAVFFSKLETELKNFETGLKATLTGLTVTMAAPGVVVPIVQTVPLQPLDITTAKDEGVKL